MAKQFSVIIKKIGAKKKTSVAKIVCEITSLGPQKAKALLDSKGVVAEGISKKKAEEIKAKLEVAGANVEIVSVDKPKDEIKVPVKDLEIKDLSALIKRKLISEEMIGHLKTKKIKTLSDIRRNGGIPPLKDSSPKDEKALQKLEAHAYLSLLSDDVKVNQKLIDNGFSGITKISETGRGVFIKEAEKAGIAKETATLVHSKAVAASAVLNNALTQARVEQANGFAVEPAFNIEGLFPRQCACPDSESAVSPLAYLADLLDYTMKHVQIKSAGEADFRSVTLSDLEQRFHQLFGQFLGSSAEVERKVRQVRICIEVLRRYLIANPPSLSNQSSLADNVKEYLFEAYQVLLNQIGTSYEELRLTTTADQDKRESLADRLGIDLDAEDSEKLDKLLFTREDLSERRLEQVFGLIDTTRNPLCDGIQSEDTDEQIKRWNFFGVEWNRNTDEDGNVYGEMQVTNLPPDNGLVYMVNLYKDRERTQRVASGEGTLGTFILSERNNSGLSARIQIDQEPQNNRFEISVIPSFLAWRLKHLRTLWKQQDWPADPYTEGLLPIIDPDIIGPDDFRLPIPKTNPADDDKAFDIWLTRRQEIDTGLRELNEQRTNEGLDVVLKRVLGDPLPDLDGFLENLKTGKDLEATKDHIKNMNLTVESFTRLMEIYNKNRRVEENSEGEPVSDEEWDAVHSILMQALKERSYPDWISEENEKGLKLGPQEFWIALAEPGEGLWSPALHNQRPLIDPELVTLDDLVVSPTGLQARSTWRSRTIAVEAIKNNMQSAYATGRLSQALRAALGMVSPRPDPNQPTWIEIMMQIDEDLRSLDATTRENAQEQVERQFYMSIEDFSHLIMIKQKEDDSEKEPSEEELNKLYSILTTACKRRTLITDWKQEEEEENLLYWRVLSARLPLWRASRETRQQWQYTLRTRNKSPIIDPDLIGEKDLKNSLEGPAYDIWQARKGWIEAHVNEIKQLREEEKACLIWGAQGTNDGQFRSPRDVAVDREGDIYVADRENNRIQKFDSNGSFLKKWGSRGKGNGQFLFPQSIAVDNSGNIYVSDSSNHRVQKFNSNGDFLKMWGGKPSSEEGLFNNPTGIGIDDNGDIYVADSGNHRIQKFDSNEVFLHAWGTQGSGDGQFNGPVDVVPDKTGNIYVSDSSNHRIQKFGSNGVFLKKWGTQGSGNGQFNSPSGIGVDVNGYIYVSDLTNRIQKFDAEGTFLEKWGSLGTGDMQFNFPQGIAVDGDGNVYVAEALNHRIQLLIFDPNFGFKRVLKNILGVDIKEFLDLAVQRKQGNDITARFDQLSLDMDAFLYLMRVYALLESGAEVMDSEWDGVYSILVQVKKRRMSADWRDVEQESGITLSPDFFQTSEEEFELLPWRASREARWDWEDKLSARIDQERTVMTAMAEVVDGCEEATLALLRDALVEASTTEGNDITEKAKWLTDQLLIDFQIAPCQKTTRISQALTTLQNLIFSLRTGQFQQPEHEMLQLDPEYEHFDEEWMWIGSYETWKAAVGVFLYPENILLPSLRRQASPAFRSLIGVLRSNQRITPVLARQLALEYSDYLNDVATMAAQATCTAETATKGNETELLFYVFALGGKTGKVYWSYLLPENAQETQTFWIALPVDELGDVVKIIGAVPYYIADEARYIFLFLVTANGGKQELVFVRYDLNKMYWDAEVQSLDLPTDSSNISALVKQREDTDQPPHIVIRVNDGTIYDQYLSSDGRSWASGDWKPIINGSKGKTFDRIAGFFEWANRPCLIAESSGSIYYRIFGYRDDGSWRLIENGSYIGALSSISTDTVGWYTFYQTPITYYKKLISPVSLTETYSIDTLNDFNDWLITVYNLDLHDYHILEFWSSQNKWFYNLYDLLNEPDSSSDLQNLKLRNIESFIDKIKDADYSDEVYGEWRLVAETVTALSGISDSLSGILWRIIVSITLEFARRSEDNISEQHQIRTQPSISIIPPNWGFRTGIFHFDHEYEFSIFVYQKDYLSDGIDICCVHNFWPEYPTEFTGYFITPNISRVSTLSDQIHPESIQRERYEQSKIAYQRNCMSFRRTLPNNLEYIKEMYYFVPVAIAIRLQWASQFEAALNWFRTVYDYAKPRDKGKIYYGLEYEDYIPGTYERLEDWLLDPLNPHTIASTRKNTYTRFTLLYIIQCLLAYADAEFTRDTVESLAKARTLYETALELLETPELNQHLGLCEDIIGYLEIELEDLRWQGVWERILDDVRRINNMSVLESTVNNVRNIMQSSKELSARIAKARKAVNEALSLQQPLTLSDIIERRNQTLAEIPGLLLKNNSIEKGIAKSVMLIENTYRPAAPLSEELETRVYTPVVGGAYIPMLATLAFCIPPNPMIKALRFHAEINLYKIRTCRNIAGIKREIEAYAAPTDILSAMPSIGPGGQLTLPTRITPPPVPYRYEFLIERAKQLANMAAQMEAALLAALEKRDVELYNLLKARQGVQLARAGVKLQNLRLRQARDEVELAELQRESAEIQAQTYKEWLDAGLNVWELQMIDAYHSAAAARTLAAFCDAGATMFQAATSAAAAFPTNVPAAQAQAILVSLTAMGRYVASGMAIQAETQAQVASVWASYERRAQEWQLQSELAQHSIRIGDQQIEIANDGVNIVHQEGEIARMQVEHAEAVVEFLQNKFTSAELYDWMSNILEGVYSFFLQHATSMAKLAQNQLAFERQEPPPAFIQNDYWEVPSEDSIGGASQDATDRHGLTGSARLMADIYKLDQYRLETEKRKLQLTKAISLARMAPYEFQRFRETGVMVFATPMELFDRDFPGHYLRMIKRVRTSVVALIPPTQGIKATLSNIGISRLVVNRNMLFQTITAHRPPESVALTSPVNATGLFELETQSEMLLPFERLGVDTIWEFRMPKAANQFDYLTIADIIVALEYTALDSPDYRQQVIESLPTKISANRPFSFRHQFADQWYDLHNPDQTATPMAVRFQTRREDFLPNIERLKIDQILLYFAGLSKETTEMKATLTFKPDGKEPAIGGEATAVDGMISTRRGAWPLLPGMSVVGNWELALPDTPEIRSLFKNEEIEDILFVITYSGRTPEWPA